MTKFVVLTHLSLYYKICEEQARKFQILSLQLERYINEKSK